MANAPITSSIATESIPEIWIADALQPFRSNIVLARGVYKNAEIDPKGYFTKGDIAHIRKPGTFTVGDKSEGSDVTLQQPTDTHIDVTLNKHKYVAVVIEDFAATLADRSLQTLYLPNILTAIANKVEDDLFGLYTGLSGSVGTSGANLSYGTIVDTSKALNDNNVPQGNRWLVYSTKDDAALRKDTDVKTYFANSRPELLEQGILAQVSGFNMAMSTRVPVVAGSPNSTKNLAFDPSAFVLASRMLAPDAEAVPGAGKSTLLATVTDAVSGLIFRLVLQYQGLKLGVLLVIDTLYGVAELRDEAGVVVLS